jgi:uncharacterized membrane protein
MATLTVLEFETAEGAEQMAGALQELQRQRLITVQDAAVVSWPKGAKKPKTRQLMNLAAGGALGGAFWGLLFGLIFFVPLLGVAIGAGIGALTGSLMDVGIDDNFIKRVRAEITEGNSALFLLSSEAVPDRLAEEMQARGLHFKLIASNLTQEQETRLREIFSAE